MSRWLWAKPTTLILAVFCGGISPACSSSPSGSAASGSASSGGGSGASASSSSGDSAASGSSSSGEAGGADASGAAATGQGGGVSGSAGAGSSEAGSWDGDASSSSVDSALLDSQAPDSGGGRVGDSGVFVEAGLGGDAGREDAAVTVPPGCTLPTPVGFKADVQPFLASSCGNGAAGPGCHVLDATSTVSSGGYDHAYDWITGTAHASSCPEVPTPLRFQVVVAVIDQANPVACSKSRKMPPDATHSPLSACQRAILQSWLDEPLVTQMHRADTISPTTPYPMPPYN